jgi:hypothetical protein
MLERMIYNNLLFNRYVSFPSSGDCESIHHPAKKRRHSSMDAGIQSQGCEAA